MFGKRGMVSQVPTTIGPEATTQATGQNQHSGKCANQIIRGGIHLRQIGNRRISLTPMGQHIACTPWYQLSDSTGCPSVQFLYSVIPNFCLFISVVNICAPDDTDDRLPFY